MPPTIQGLLIAFVVLLVAFRLIDLLRPKEKRLALLRRPCISAALSLALSPAPASGDKGLLLQVIDLESGKAFRAVAALQATPSGWTTSVPIFIAPMTAARPGRKLCKAFPLAKPSMSCAKTRNGKVFFSREQNAPFMSPSMMAKAGNRYASICLRHPSAT